MLNVATNAIQAAGEGARLEITASPRHDGYIEIALSDNGPGIPEDVRERVFEPFFTTRSQGTGLGLAVVRAVVRGHNGEVKVANSNYGGAQVTLRLPMAGQALPSGQDSGALLADAGAFR